MSGLDSAPPDLQPSVSVGIKLASLAVHADELLSPDGSEFDNLAIRSLLADSEVVAYLETLRPLALLPVKRDRVAGASEGAS